MVLNESALPLSDLAPSRETASVPSPWDDLNERGSGLPVKDFLTTMLDLTSNALRRKVTLPYTQQFGLTMPEWRIVSVLAEADAELSFAELVVRSATNKGQLSRTLRTLQGRALVAMRTGVGKKVDCLITPAGRGLYEQVIPVARRAQAVMIRQLSGEAPQDVRLCDRASSRTKPPAAQRCRPGGRHGRTPTADPYS